MAGESSDRIDAPENHDEEEKWWREELEERRHRERIVRQMGIIRKGTGLPPPALNPDGSPADPDAYEDQDGDTDRRGS